VVGGEEQRKEEFQSLYSLSNNIIRLGIVCILHIACIKYNHIETSTWGQSCLNEVKVEM
jgi:hypothetical protein